jgi:hypothetical protein
MEDMSMPAPRIRYAVLVAVAAMAGGLPPIAGAQPSEDEQMLEQKSGGTSTPPPSTSSSSASDDDDYELSTTYSSIGLQKVAVDVEGFETQDPVNLDITLIGFRIPTVKWFGVELNLGFTMIPGEISTSSSGSPGSCLPVIGCSGGSSGSSRKDDLGMTTASVFAVARSTGSVFAMGKLGYRYLSSSIEDFPEDRTGSAWGAGIGYRWNKKGSYAEFGYTKYSPEVSALGFALSYSYERR